MKNGKYLLLSDLDGTLLTTDKRVTARTREALTRFSEMGNVFAICTGRDITSARLVYAGLGLDLPGSCIASFNGGLLAEAGSDKVLFRTGLRPQLVREAFAIADELGLHAQTYTDTHILSPGDDPELAFYRRVIKTPVITGPDALDHMSEYPYKIILIELGGNEKQERYKELIQARYGDEVKVVRSAPEYLEVIPNTSGKDQAVMRLAEALGIPQENTIAAGDADNDLDMIIAAGTGIAMKNGTEAVRAAADIITEFDNDHDGLAEALLAWMEGMPYSN